MAVACFNPPPAHERAETIKVVVVLVVRPCFNPPPAHERAETSAERHKAERMTFQSAARS